MREKLIFLGCCTLVLIIGCIESYDLPVRNAEVNFLVVDGFLNTANGKVTVSLTRATPIAQSEFLNESYAIVALEDLEGNQYSLVELDSGQYTGIAPSVVSGQQYRLYIKTLDGPEYHSAFVTLKDTPEIKELTWKTYPDGVQIIVDTEDPTNQTRFYRWAFEETWEYRSRFASYCSLVVTKDTVQVIPRSFDQFINVCYRTQRSRQIFTTSTAALSQDQVNDFELAFLPKGTEKLGYGYSILVQQYAITQEAYEYYEKLKKTSQGLGGLFDPQPSKVTGNILNINDPNEVVLGFFNAGQATEKRIFVKPDQLPRDFQFVTPDAGLSCWIDSAVVRPPDTLPEVLERFSKSTQHVPVDALQVNFVVYGITYALKECVDCRLEGGVTRKPDFWP